MKIERLNDNQFRCTITLGELLQRHLTMKKLAGGGGDARRLVKEMIELSESEVGFVPNDLPVMVEATPTPEGNLTFTITKVNSLDELPPANPQEAAARMMHLIAQALNRKDDEEPVQKPDPFAAFCFEEKTGVVLPPTLKKAPRGVRSALYRAPKAHVYYLIVYASEKYTAELSRVCLLLSEYARLVPAGAATKAYFDERYDVIYAARAIEHLNEEPKG